jgi:hypothetical protein
MTAIVPAEVITRALEFLWDWPERSRARLVCRRWDRAFTGLLENSLSSQQSQDGEWTPVGRYCTKHILCHLHRMPLEVLASLTAVDWNRSYLGDRINEAVNWLIRGLQNRKDIDGCVSNLAKLNFTGCHDLSAESLQLLATACDGSLCRSIQSLTFPRHFGFSASDVESLHKFSNLRHLTLSGARVVPPRTSPAIIFSKFTALESLELEQCQFVTNSVLKGITTSGQGLKVLAVKGCPITDESAGELKLLTQLEELRLAECNRLSSIAVGVIASLPKLQVLDLGSCGNIGDEAMKTFVGSACRTTLRVLRLANLKLLTDQGMHDVAALPNLTELNVSLCRSITDAGVTAFACGASRFSLTSLNLSSCSGVTDVSVKAVAELPSLQSLDLSWCNTVTDAGVEVLRGATQLRSLAIRECSVTDVGVEAISSLPSLAELHLSVGEGITDRSFEALSEVCTLQTLGVYRLRPDCPCITDVGLTRLAKGCPNIKSLTLPHREGLSDSGVVQLAAMRGLESLRLYGCDRITDASLQSLLPVLRHLTCLGLAGCAKVTDASVLVAARLPVLTSLDVSSTCLSDIGLLALAKDTETLEDLSCSKCASVTDKGVVALACLYRLRSLSLDFCHRLTDLSVRVLATLPALRFLNMFRCERISEQALEPIKHMRGGVIVVH